MEKKLTKEKLLEIIESSGDGTLARREAEFILNSLYGSEDGKQTEELSAENLDKIAGGKASHRAVAAALSLGILGGSIVPQARADITDDVKKFVKDNPKTTKAIEGVGIGMAAVAGVLGLTRAGQHIGAKIYTRNIHTDVENMSPEELQRFLDDQISKFEARGIDNGQALFKVGNAIKKEANKEILALAVSSLNIVLDKVPKLEEALKAYAEVYNLPFVFDWETKGEYKRPHCAYFTLDENNGTFGVKINKKFGKSMTYTQAFAKRTVKSGFHSPLDMNHLIEAAIAHEMGHAWEELVAIPYANIMAYEEYKSSPVKDSGRRVSKSLKMYLGMTVKYRKYGSKVWHDAPEHHISNYGDTSDSEWAAECFAQYIFGDATANKDWSLMQRFSGVVNEINIDKRINYEKVYSQCKDLKPSPDYVPYWVQVATEKMLDEAIKPKS